MPTVARAYTPAELRAVAEQLAQTYADAERRILKSLAEGNITEWKAAFQKQQLAQIRGILATLEAESRAWIDFHLPTLYQNGMRVTDGHLAPGGLSRAAHPGLVTPMDLGLARMHTEAISIIGENAALRLGEANNYVAQRIEDIVARARRIAKMQGTDLAATMGEQLAIRDASLEALQAAFAEGQTAEQAAKTFLKDLRKRGITSFVDKAGKAWDMESYSRMVARTVSQEAQRHGTQNRMLEAGYDLVKVSTHAAACELCIPWENEILSITGETKGYATIGEATAAGLFHPNCAHSVLPYVSEAGRLSKKN